MAPSVGGIRPLGARSSSLPIAMFVQTRADMDPTQFEPTNASELCSRTSTQQVTSPTEGVSLEPPASEDDDVQIIFCAPRRRKKRRRRNDDAEDLKIHAHKARLESTHLASPNSQVCRPPNDRFPSPEIHHVVPQSRRRSTSVVQRLDSCHFGQEKSPSVRAGSLPFIPCVASKVPDVQYPWFAEPSYYGISAPQFPSLMDSGVCWDQSLPTLQPRPLPSIPWKPLPVEDPNSRKRKHNEDVEEALTKFSQCRQSVQISPRTAPATLVSPLFSPYHINPNQFNMYSLDQQLPASPMWPSDKLDILDNFDTNHHGSSVARQSPVLLDLSASDIEMVETSQPQRSSVDNRPDHTMEVESWQHSRDRTGTRMASSQHRIPPFRSLHLPGSGDQLLHPVASPTPHSNPHASHPPSGTIASNIISNHHGSRPVATLRPGHQAVSSHASAAPFVPRGNNRVAQSSDMLRKPSLYSIPPWPSPLDMTVPPVASTIIQSHSRSPISNTTGEITHSRVNRLGSPHVLDTIPQRIVSETRVHAAGITPAKAASPVSSPRHAPASPRTATFEIPNARLGRKRSPNLIVDIAEICQDLFPFAEVAEHHDVPLQKVFDTFSAIIQLPLLRNADDRRRHGSLGKRRMKEYRDAKKAMERAHEAERKAQTKDTRARVEDTARKGKDGRNQPLLKSAVLNNAREFHGAD